jgi:hypothetical protein
MSVAIEPAAEDAVSLRLWAHRYRHFAVTLFDRRTAAEVEHRAREFEAAARALEADEQQSSQGAA